MNEETARTIERLGHELNELRRANAQMARSLRRSRFTGIAAAACFVLLGSCTPGWIRAIRAQAPAAPDGFQVPAPPPGQAAPAAPEPMGGPLIEVGRFYISPFHITHSYVSNGQRYVFFGAAQPIVLDARESELLRRFVSVLPAPIQRGDLNPPPGVPQPNIAPPAPDRGGGAAPRGNPPATTFPSPSD